MPRLLKLDPIGADAEEEDRNTLLERGELKVYSQRWVVLLSYWLLALSNNSAQGCLVPVSKKAMEWYQINPYQLDMLVIVYSISGISWRWVCMYVLDSDKYGLGWGIHAGATLNAAGTVVSYIGSTSRDGYPLILLGSCLGAMGMGFIDIAPTKISAAWFPVKERSFATAIGTLSIMLAATFSYLSAPWIIRDDPATEFPTYFLVMAIIGCSVCVFSFLVFRSKPPTPPSLSASQPRMRFAETVRGVFRNRNYNIGLVLFCTTAASSAAFHTLFGQILASVNYTTSQIGILGGAPIVTGVVGIVFSGWLLDRTHRYKAILITYAAVTTGLYVWFTLGLQPNNYSSLLANRALYGIFGVAQAPAAFETLVEVSYPFPEATVMGITFFFMNVFIILYTFVFQWLQLPNGSFSVTMWTVTVLNGLAVFVGSFFDGQFTRLEYDTAPVEE